MRKCLIVYYVVCLFFTFFVVSPCYSQSGNSVSGHIFGPQRQPVGEINVELLDDFSRSIARSRTNASGYYSFNRVPSGRFRIRVLPYGFDYEEQEQEVEIVNFTRETAGGIRTSGFENAQKDFYLRKRKGTEASGNVESIFVQEIPKQAQETYKEGVQLLESKQEEQGLKKLILAVEIFPNYYEAIERLGIEYIRLQHFEAAQILLSKAVEINSRSYKSWYSLAYAFYSLNYTKEASESLQKAISLNQFSVNAFLLDGLLCRRKKDYKQAEKQLKKANELAKGLVPEVHWQLALLYGNNLNRYSEAADELQTLLKIQPNHANAENIKKLIKQFREKG